MGKIAKAWFKSVAILPLAFAVQGAIAVTLAPVGDTFIQDGKGVNRDHGTREFLIVSNSPNSTFDRKAYLNFDLASIDTQSIDSAVLRFYARKIKRTVALDVQLAKSQWSKSLTWRTAPIANSAEGQLTLNLSPKQTRQWIDLDVTALAKKRGGQTLNLMIGNPTQGKGTAVWMGSSEKADQSPQLIVDVHSAENDDQTSEKIAVPTTNPGTGGQGLVVDSGTQVITDPDVVKPDDKGQADDSSNAFAPDQPVDTKADTHAGGDHSVVSGTISGSVSGLTVDSAAITASGGGELHTAVVVGDVFTFTGLNPEIDYSIKVQAEGLRQKGLITTKPGKVVELVMQPMPNLNSDGLFNFVWEGGGQDVSGLEYASAVNKPITVTVQGQEKEIPNIAAAQMLYRDYRVVLDNSGDVVWTQAHAYRLLETMRQIPQSHCDDTASVLGLPCKGGKVSKSVWKLSNSEVTNDIQWSSRQVTLGTAAFTYAEPAIATIDGRKGRYFSKRLHHALVRKLTNNGHNLKKANFILEKRFGVTIDTRKNGPAHWSNLESTYRNIAVIDEDREASAWQSFTPEEVLIVINQFEEMPTGMHVIRGGANNEKGLKFLFRRANGHDHPLYPGAPAVAWPQAGYIEFMEKAFKGSNLEHMQRLVLHEKSHFLWHYVVSEQQKEEWYKLSDWFRLDGDESEHSFDLPYNTEGGTDGTHSSGFNPQTLNASVYDKDGWSARKTTNFVSAYAQLKNPNEDMAESISYFLMNPDKLRSRAPGKYEFIKERLMAGIMYLQEIREDLTFEVLNLHPDYVYPGKIKRVEIKVEGQADQDKRVTIELELHTTKESCSAKSCLEGASRGFTRLFSEAGTTKDLYFYPVGGSTSNKLRGSMVIPNTAKNGWWAPAQITITDPVGNERFQRNTDYGWQLFVNNPAEDTVPPKYVKNSMSLDLSEPKVVEIKKGLFSRNLSRDNCEGYSSKYAQCRVVRTLTARWDVNEDVKMDGRSPCFSRFSSNDYKNYSMDEYGDFTSNIQGAVDGQCQTQIMTTEYYRSGQYKVAQVSLLDRALNRGGEQFSDNHYSREASPKVYLDNSQGNPDTRPVEMNIQSCSSGDEQCIHIEGTPTNAENPNGETNVVLTYWARDDKSGLGTVSYNLRDPQGKNHFFYAYHKNSYTLFFDGKPTSWTKYVTKTTLPKGSAPGKWGLSEMTLFDKAGNKKAYDFTETVIFEPFDVK